MVQRTNLIRGLCDRISRLEGRAVVGVDGVDGAGKTVFAGELASMLMQSGRSVIQASVDGFHNDRALRYRRGKSDPQGFFEDSYNYELLRNDLIDPFRKGESKVSVARFNHAIDAEISDTATVEPSAILVIDGIFLHRDELVSLWDFSIFLSVPFSVCYARLATRDGSNPDPRAVKNRRYYEGQQIYLSNCKPAERATVVIDNSEIEAPQLLNV